MQTTNYVTHEKHMCEIYFISGSNIYFFVDLLLLYALGHCVRVVHSVAHQQKQQQLQQYPQKKHQNFNFQGTSAKKHRHTKIEKKESSANNR